MRSHPFRFPTVCVGVLALGLSTAASCERGPTSTKTRAPEPTATAPAAVPIAIDGARMMGLLEKLASDELAGRYTLAQADIDRAADLVIGELKAARVAPVGPDYRSPFQVTTGAKLKGEPTFTARNRAIARKEFVPVPHSGSGRAKGEVVFVGYAAKADADTDDDDDDDDDEKGTDAAARAKPESYDDLAGIDLKGKIALVLLEAPGRPDLGALFRRFEQMHDDFEAEAKPLRDKGDDAGLEALHTRVRKRVAAMVEPFLRGMKLPAEYWAKPADVRAPLDMMAMMQPIMQAAAKMPGPKFDMRGGRLSAKLERLRDAGAVGVIAVHGPQSFLDEDERKRDPLPESDDGSPAGKTFDFPVVQMRWKAAEKAFKVGGRKLSALQKAIDTELVPRSGATGVEVELGLDLDRVGVSAPNVLAYIPGSEKPQEIVLLGAHYDHTGSDAPGKGQCSAVESAKGKDAICNGADDNGSGTVMVVEVARALAAAGWKPKRSIVFALFAGEEIGLWGSRALAENPPAAAPFSGGRVVAMVNLDMVGRLGQRGLAIGGLSSSAGWMPLLDRVGTGGIEVVYERSVTSRSDHASFYKKDIPVLFFFTHVHADYHRPGDEFAKINRDGMTKIAELVVGVVRELGDGEALAFTEPRTPEEGLVAALPGANPATVEKKVAAKAPGSG